MVSEFINRIVPSILAEYHKHHDVRDVPIKIDHIKQMVEMRGVVDRIIWEEFDYVPTGVLAQVVFYEASLGMYAGNGTYARIQFSSSLNFCWKRFVVMKEMMHCLIDETQDSKVSNINDLSKLNQMLVSDEYANIEEFLPHETENLAEIIALEILFPLELRSHHRELYEAGEITDYQLALRYRVPEHYVRLAMLKGYYQAVERIRGGNLIDIT